MGIVEGIVEKGEEQFMKSDQKVRLAHPTHLTKLSISRITIGNAQTIGKRKQQQDAFGWSEISKKGITAILADGMGGLAFGAETAKRAVHMFQSKWDEYTVPRELYLSYESSHKKIISHEDSFIQWLENTIEVINQTLFEVNSHNDTLSGTTIVVAILLNNRLYWASVGDSRLYLLRNHKLYQVTEDHNLYNLQLRRRLNGTNEYTEYSPELLTSYLGNPNPNDIDISRKGFHLRTGDSLILCTDGIYRTLSEARIIDLMQYDASSAAYHIIEEIDEQPNDSQDNGTVLIINYNEKETSYEKE